MNIDKRVAALLPAMLPLSLPVFGQETKKPMNIIFFLVDDMGYGDLGYLGNPVTDSPNIDAFASSSTVFTSGYAAPESSPTRASLMTGKNPARVHITTWVAQPDSKKALSYKGWKMPQEASQVELSEYLISEALKDNGYDTWHIGKWHIGEEPYSPKKQGFDTEIAYWPWSFPKSYVSPYGLPTIEDGPKGEYLTDRLTDEAVKLIMNHGEKPFFLNLWHYAVHGPLKARPDYLEYYRSQGLPEDGKNQATYTAMKRSVDDSFGRILEAVNAAGIEDNTVIVFFTDNGGTIKHGDNGALRMGKKFLYEGGIRVPLIIRAPGMESGTSVDVPVSSIDFYPTMLHWAGIDRNTVKQHLDGEDIYSLLEDPEKAYDRALFWHEMGAFGTGPTTAMRKGDWKLLYFYTRPEGEQYELYNLKEDISETTDLSAEHPDIVRSMAAEIEEWLKDNDAQLPVYKGGNK